MSGKSGLVNNILGITSRLPWWLGVLLAVAAWFGFRMLANIEVPLATKAAESGPMVIRQGLRVVASILQYAVPVLCLIGALMSVLMGRRARHWGLMCSRARVVLMIWTGAISSAWWGAISSSVDSPWWKRAAVRMAVLI